MSSTSEKISYPELIAKVAGDEHADWRTGVMKVDARVQRDVMDIVGPFIGKLDALAIKKVVNSVVAQVEVNQSVRYLATHPHIAEVSLERDGK